MAGLTSGTESTIDTYVPTVDISDGAATATQIQAEIKTARDRLRITNQATQFALVDGRHVQHGALRIR